MEFFLTDYLGAPCWAWISFFVIVLALLAFDLGVLNKKDHEIGIQESLWLSLFYICVACLFGAAVWNIQGPERGIEYFTGYVVEKSLSLDNVFVISLIFASFDVPRLYQHRVLFWGVLGVILLRGLMIGLGAALVREYHWILFVFGGFLILTGIKMIFSPEHERPIAEHPVVKFLQRHIPLTHNIHGHQFIAREKNPETGKMKLYATPLLLTLILVELADVVFAVDSVPAIFAITQDTFIVYTSNIFAILGLRALYFALAAVIHRFAYLKYALALVLVFIGGKIFYNEFFEKIDPAISLGVTFSLLTIGVIVSVIITSFQKNDDVPTVTAKDEPTS
ncbi:MAG: TerC/Alx family metal homeostasis membrane protein [Rhizobiales bacterium]|nr:TerC/Alx family metal homeostasis membrane protein [Hyphomicrobiales bacterium]